VSGDLAAAAGRYYADRLANCGTTPAGVDWNSAEGQTLRFDQLLKVVEPTTRPFTLNDFGCGYGALADHLERSHLDCGAYTGFDIAPEMIAAAQARRPRDRFVTREADLGPADYTVASGVFNVRQDAARGAWEAYVLEVLERIAAVSRRGLAVNLLTSWSDPRRMRDDLYYADPAVLFAFAKRHLARDVAILHDYGLYEFTLVVRFARG
jgi:SAM-dependent methyltransferase